MRPGRHILSPRHAASAATWRRRPRSSAPAWDVVALAEGANTDLRNASCETVVGVVVRAGRSEARRASRDPSERCRSGAAGGGEAGVARPVAGGGATPLVGRVVAVRAARRARGRGRWRRARAVPRDGWSVGGCRVGAGGGGCARVRCGCPAWRRAAAMVPWSGRAGPEQRGEWVGDFDRVVAELEADPWAVQVEVVAAEGDDPGDALAVEQDQAARDAGM
jgi:hypothetical protein